MVKDAHLTIIRPVATTFETEKKPSGEKKEKAPVKERLEKRWQTTKGGGRFPWQPTVFDRLRKYPLSPNFILASQLGIGAIWCGIFTVVRPITFPESCLSSVFLLASLVLLSQSATLGSKLQAAAFLLFAAAYSLPYVGSIASLARTPGSAFTGTLNVFAVVALVPVAALRAAPGNPGPGLMFMLMFGVGTLNSITVWPAGVLWREVIGNLMAAMCVSSAGTIISASLVLPVLAGDELRSGIGQALQGIGHHLSAQASTLFSSRDGPHVDVPELARLDDEQEDTEARKNTHPSLKNLRSQMLLPEEGNSTERLLMKMRQNSDPDRPKAVPDYVPPHPDTKSLRAILAKCQANILEAEYEPAFLQSGPQDSKKWAQLLKDVRNLLTRATSLRLLVEGGQLLHTSIFLEMCEFDPLPNFKRVFAELACACAALGLAAKSAGKQQAELLLTAMPWQQIRAELKESVDSVNHGYWSRHRRQRESKLINSPQALEVRVILFLATLTHGLIDALAAIESSMPAALGHADKDAGTRRNLGLPRAAVKSAGGKAAEADMHAAPNGKEHVASERQLSNGKASTSNGEVKLQLGAAGEKSRPLKLVELARRNTSFLWTAAKMISGYTQAFRMKGIFWDEARRTFRSKEELMVTLRSRRVHYAFKYWLVCSSVLTIGICLDSNYPRTREWRLYYAFLTATVICIERVEAVAWKIVQRVIGTFIGGTLGYLIMLRKHIHQNGASVLALVCASTFVIAQFLQTSLRYTVFLTILTMTSLTICQYPQVSRPGSDFEIWVARVVNIICGSLIAMAVSWLVLPWYASDEHLELLANAYVTIGGLAGDFYAEFHRLCQAAAEGTHEPDAKPKFAGRLEGEVVRDIEAVLLGLQRDTVLWTRGLFATPQIVLKLVAEMRLLLLRMAAMELAVVQSPEVFGPSSSLIYENYGRPLHGPNLALVEGLKSLTEACRPVLVHGWSAERASSVCTALEDVEQRRASAGLLYQKLRANEHSAALAGGDALEGVKTAADSVKLSSWLVAASKVCDQVMLIAKVIAGEANRGRDNRLTCLVPPPWAPHSAEKPA